MEGSDRASTRWIDTVTVLTLPRFFVRMNELVLFLTQHWLQLVEDTGSANRSRWPTHPTWLALRSKFAAVAQAQPLDEDQRILMRGSR